MQHSFEYARAFRNLRLFNQFVKERYDYILNLENGELHKAIGGSVFGSHNLLFANLGRFVGLFNLHRFPIHLNFDGKLIPIFDAATGSLAMYPMNKCRHCFPNLK